MSTIETKTADWFNQPEKWRTNVPAPVGVDWFQKELNLIGGKTLQGTPHYRIVWGMDVEASVIRDRYRDRFIPRYLYKILTSIELLPPVDGGVLHRPVKKETFIGTPRYYVEAFIPPEIACASGTAEGRDADGDKFSAWMPSDGDWFPMIEICTHDEFGICCQNAFNEDRNCHGEFRVPNQRDIDTIRHLYQQMMKTRRHRPDEKVPVEVANDAFRYAVERERKRREAIEAELAYNGANFMKAHGFTGNAKYHALPGVAIPGVTNQGWSVAGENE